MKQVKQEYKSLQKEMKLWQIYLLNFWRDGKKEYIKNDDIIERVDGLYWIQEGVGYLEIEGYSGRVSYYIGFRQPIPV